MNATPVLKMARWFDIIPEEKRGLGTIVCMCKEKTLLSRSVIVLPVFLCSIKGLQ